MRSTRTPDVALTFVGGESRYAVVDFLRAFSILTVVLMHLAQFMPSLPSLARLMVTPGGTGAHVFIFCSGFGLYLSHLRRPQRAGRFILRRLGRVYLPYVPVVLISAAIPALYPAADRSAALLSHLFLYKMFIPRYMESFGVQFWFISTIVQFYLVFLPLCRLRERMGRMRWLVLLAVAVSAAWWIVLAATGLYVERIWNSFFLQFVWEFVLGMAVAEYFHCGGKLTLRLPLLTVVAIVGLSLQAGIALWGGYPLRLFNDIPALFGYGALALLLYASLRGRFDRIAARAADCAYPLYLLHTLVFTLVFSLCPGGLAAELGFGVLALALSLLAAWGYGSLIDFIQRNFRRSYR